MAEHSTLAPLRRWLIQPGSPQKILTILLGVTLMAAAALVGLQNETGAGGNDLVDIENSGPAAP